MLLTDLPLELMLGILEYLSLRDLARLSGVCRGLRGVCSDPKTWRTRGQRYINFDSNANGTEALSMRDRCRLAFNWNSGRYQKSRSTIKIDLNPMIKLISASLFVGLKHQGHINRYDVMSGGRLKATHQTHANAGYIGVYFDDFLVNEDEVITCHHDVRRGGSKVKIWDQRSGEILGEFTRPGVSKCIDATKDIMVLGGEGVQIWNRRGDQGVHHVTPPTSKGIRRVRIDPSARIFATASMPGINNASNLIQIWDLETAKITVCCGEGERTSRFPQSPHTVHYESPSLLLADDVHSSPAICQWDIRIPRFPVLELRGFGDSLVSCFASDNDHFVGAGYCSWNHNLKFWDKRKLDNQTDNSLKSFYVGERSWQDVSSIQFDRQTLYAAVNNDVVYVLDFDVG